MIDTIAIMLDQSQFEISDHGRFSPDSRNLFESPYYPFQNGRITCVQNPSSADRQTGIYRPRLTLTKRIVQRGLFSITLRIEFSIPKLFHGNNFMEVTDKNFREIISLLNASLKEMGIKIHDPFKILPDAAVSAVHYSKNFILTENVTCSMILHELSKADVTKTLDLTNTDYRNGGHAYRLHANSFDVIWYDKIKDLQKARISEKRAIEKESYCQLDIFSDTPATQKIEVFRMEVRLGNRRKIHEMLKKLEYHSEPLFKNLFISMLAQKVLLYFWKKIYDSSLFISLPTQGPIKSFSGLLKRNPRLKPNKALQVFAALTLIEKEGIPAFRNIYGLHGNERAWSRLKADLTALDLSDLSGFIASEQITRGLTLFEPVKSI